MTEKNDYTKPEMNQVKLTPEEAVLQHCKTTVNSTGEFCVETGAIQTFGS